MSDNLPCFDLAPLERYDPKKIVPESRNDRLPSFILAMASVFNDLKDILQVEAWLMPMKPSVGGISPDAGEWQGFYLQIHRLAFGLLHELFKLLREFEEEAGCQEIRQIVRVLHPVVRQDWHTLVRIATTDERNDNSEFARVLLLIRNNLSFHYYQPKPLLEGFKTHFFNSPPTSLNEYAYSSNGKNMEQTRFYFADAAVQAALISLEDTMGRPDFEKKFRSTITKANFAVSQIVEGYLHRAKLRSRQ